MHEIEAKFIIRRPEQVGAALRVLESSGFAISPRGTTKHADVYYDTEDWSVLAAVSLRLAASCWRLLMLSHFDICKGARMAYAPGAGEGARVLPLKPFLEQGAGAGQSPVARDHFGAGSRCAGIEHFRSPVGLKPACIYTV